MQQLGLGFSAARKTVGGTYEIDALYYEVKVPLVTRNMDIPFVEGLTLDFSGRTIENTLAGDYDVEALSVAWAVTNDITFRYSDQTAIKLLILVTYLVHKLQLISLLQTLVTIDS